MVRITLLLALMTALAVPAQDSPLVALAKRSNRKASKTPVITNQTVGSQGGRMAYVAESPAGQPAQTSATAPGIAVAAIATPVPAAPAQNRPAATVTAGQPAGTAADLPTTARVVAPQSTARNVEAYSTVRTVQPASSAASAAPQSTVRTLQPVSTVQTVQPPSSNRPPQ